MEKVAAGTITPEEAVVEIAQTHIDEKRFPELDYDHPLNILDIESPQYKEALAEYQEKKNESPLPKSGDLTGVTVIEYEDEGTTLIYGTKNNRVRVPTKGMSKQDIQNEIDFEKKVNERAKRDIATFDENAIRNSITLTLQEKADIIKMHKQSVLNLDRTEKIVIPFYESRLKAIETEEPKKDFFKEHVIFAKVPPVTTSRSEFLEYLSDLDGWEQFEGDKRYYRKFVFKKDQMDAARDITDRGVKESLTDRPDGGMTAIISVKYLEDANAISNIYEDFTDSTISRKNYYTTAPISADGFGTKTIETTDWLDRSEKPVRKVSITDRNFEWQSTRYASGNWAFFDEVQFEKYAPTIFHKKEVVATEEKTEDVSTFTDEKLSEFLKMLEIPSASNVFGEEKRQSMISEIKAEIEKRKTKKERGESYFKSSEIQALKEDMQSRFPFVGNVKENNVLSPTVFKLVADIFPRQKLNVYLKDHTSTDFWGKEEIDIVTDYFKTNNIELSTGGYPDEAYGVHGVGVSVVKKGELKFDYKKKFAYIPTEENEKVVKLEEVTSNATGDSQTTTDNSAFSDLLSRYPKLTKKQVSDVYNKVETILAKGTISEDDRYILEQYEGMGSQTHLNLTKEEQKGLLHQFYTPYVIGKGMFDLAKHYGFNGGTILEPSMGTGRFFKFAPEGSKCIGFDPDEKNIKIAKLLYPDATTYQEAFETAFLEQPRLNKMARKSWLPEIDLVIGNPPYGDYQSYYKSFMPSIFKRFEFLFIYLGLKALKPGGLLVFIVSQNFMNNGAMYNGMKAKILELGTFVDAIRLPNGIFSTTEVGTDIVIFRKK